MPDKTQIKCLCIHGGTPIGGETGSSLLCHISGGACSFNAQMALTCRNFDDGFGLFALSGIA